MSEATVTTNSNPNPDKKSKTPSIETLTKRKEFLENKLKAVQDILEEKQRAKAEKKREKAEKDRTRALILFGLYYLENYKNMILKLNSEEITKLLTQTRTERESFYKNKQEKITSKREKAKLEAEMNFLNNFFEKEITQEAPQSEDQNQPE